MSRSTVVKMLTGNATKFAIAQAAFGAQGMDVEQLRADVPEIQSLDCVAVARHAAREAARLYGGPVFKSDVAWHIHALNGYPGALIKHSAHHINAAGWLGLMAAHTDRRIVIRECIACVWDDGREISFVDEFGGQFVDHIAGDHGTEIDKVVAINGTDRPIATFTADEQLARWRGSQTIYHQLAKYFLEQGGNQ